MMLKRAFDVVFALLVLVVLFPLFLLIGLSVALTSPGGAFFRQQRMGRNGEPFRLLKFRTMRPGSEATGQLTIGGRDPRVTRVGYLLRKTKLDELPQFWNVLVGDMSVVGPRPEVPRYVEMYSPDQREVLSVRPGITGLASLTYMDENELLAAAGDPEQAYVEKILPAKLDLELRYVKERNMWMDLRIILTTVGRLFGR